MTLLTEIVFVNNVEIIFPEIFTDDISGGVGGFVGDIGEVIELVRRRRWGGHCSEAKSGRWWRGQFVRLELEGIIIVFIIRRNLRVKKKKKMTLWRQQHFNWGRWRGRRIPTSEKEYETLVKRTISVHHNI